MPASMGSEFGKYTLTRPLAKGGMGEIFLAEVPGIGGSSRTVVLKKILRELAEEPGFVKRFVAEAQLTMSLQHGNIVQVFDTGDVNGSLYMAMEYVDGLDLRQLMKICRKSDTRLPETWIAWVLSEVASALDYAHSRVSPSGDLSPVIHRDLSPSNIMLSRDGAAKLLDFGVASVAHNREQSLSGTLRGKIRYMSPEQANGNEVSPSTDIWALGIVGIEMLLGRPLFQSMSDLDLLDTVRRGELPEGLKEELRPHQPELGELVLSCLRPSPESRPTAEEMQRALNPILSQLTNGAGYTGKDAGRWIQSCAPRVEKTMDLADALLLQVPQEHGEGMGRTRTVGVPSAESTGDSGGISQEHLSWPTAEVTAQQAKNVRNLTVQVRILIASVVLLVGFNLYTLVEPDPNAERPVPETAVPPVGERPAPGTPGTLSAGEPSKAKTPERRSFEDASERAAGRDGIEGLSAEKIPTKEIASKTVTLNVRPKTASVYQDGKFLGKGSRTLLLSGSSASKIRGKAAGYLTKTISVGPSSPKEVRLHLNPAGKGSVQFRFFPANAVIRLDGKRLDAQGANLVQRELPVGDHTLELSDGSGARKVRSFTVVEGEVMQLGTLRLQD